MSENANVNEFIALEIPDESISSNLSTEISIPTSSLSQSLNFANFFQNEINIVQEVSVNLQNNASLALINDDILYINSEDENDFDTYHIRRFQQNSSRPLFSEPEDEDASVLQSLDDESSDSTENVNQLNLPAALNRISSSSSSEYDDANSSESVDIPINEENETTINTAVEDRTNRPFIQNPSFTMSSSSPRTLFDLFSQQRNVEFTAVSTSADAPVSSSPQTTVFALHNANAVSSVSIHNTPSCSSRISAKRKLSSSESNDFKKSAIVSCNQVEDVDESMSCSICFESWTNSGSHRLTSLKCGHVFGKKCIEKWLKESEKCPQCNSKAKRRDLRLIYAKKLISLDTVELDHAQNEAEKERKEKRDCQMELAKVRMKYHISVEECERLKTQISDLQMQITAYKDSTLQHSAKPVLKSTTSTLDRKSYRLLKDAVLTQSGGCRVMDFHSKTQQFVVSQPSPHANFMTGFGVKRISACEMRGGYFTMLHQKAIKDLRFSRLTDHHLLSASQDGTLRITDLMSNAKIHEYKVGKPVWSCCWDVQDRNAIYAGLSNGSIMQFDLRNTSQCLSSVENANSKCPIVSLHHVPPTASDHFQGRGGLLTGTLDGASFWQDTGSRNNENPSLIADFKPVFLPLESGSCTGVQFCAETLCFLITFRPGRSYRSTTHLLCELNCLPSETTSSHLTCNILDTYTGGQSHKMLTRNSLFVLPDGLHPSSGPTRFACVGDEALRKVQIYDTSQSCLFQTLDSSSGPPLDILPVHTDDTPPKLAILSQNNLQLFQFS